MVTKEVSRKSQIMALPLERTTCHIDRVGGLLNAWSEVSSRSQVGGLLDNMFGRTSNQSEIPLLSVVGKLFIVSDILRAHCP